MSEHHCLDTSLDVTRDFNGNCNRICGNKSTLLPTIDDEDNGGGGDDEAVWLIEILPLFLLFFLLLDTF